MKDYIYLMFLLLLAACAATSAIKDPEKIAGVCLEAPRSTSTDGEMDQLKAIGAGYVALMPYAYMESAEKPSIQSEQDWQWWGECESGIRAMAIDAHDKGMRVMLKPHLWIGHGVYTGSLNFKDARMNALWQEDYKQYILLYARLAQSLEVEMLCIGTELCAHVASEPVYWKELIQEVRNIYKGKLTYAANWDCYGSVPFWAELDYIGIDAYFPLAGSGFQAGTSPTQAWDRWKPEMSALSDSLARPILFTEYGYRSIEDGLAEPWINDNGKKVDMTVQSAGYESLYAALWNEPWFAGGFLWKWHCKEHMEWGDRSHDFTPQGKPVMQLIERAYGAQSLKKGE